MYVFDELVDEQRALVITKSDGVARETSLPLTLVTARCVMQGIGVNVPALRRAW